jgi:cytochrome c oxidase subunit II
LADSITNPLGRPVPDGIVPEEEITRTENLWLTVVLSMLGGMMAVGLNAEQKQHDRRR